MYLSIVIPCYNEEKVLKGSVYGLINVLSGLNKSDNNYEIILVIEKSKDNTLAVARKLESEFSVIRVIENDDRYGKGYTVKRGIRSSQGQYILVVDADVPIDLKKYLNIMLMLAESSDEVGAVYTTSLWDKLDLKKRSFMRVMTTLSLFILRRFLLRHDISDSQLGCKLYRNSAVKKCIDNLTIDNYIYDIYMTDLIQANGYHIEECAVKIDKFSETSSVTLSSVISSFFTFISYAFFKRKKLLRKDECLLKCRKVKIAQKIHNLFMALLIIAAISLFALYVQGYVFASGEAYYLQIIEKQNQAGFTGKSDYNVIVGYGNKKTHPRN